MMFQNLRNDKRGQILDLIIIPGILLALIIVSIVGYKLIVETEPSITALENVNTTIALEALENGKSFMTAFDLVLIFAIGGLALALIISAFFIRSHPFFFVIALILLIVAIAYAGFIEFIYEQFEVADQVSTTAANFPIASLLFGNFPLVILVLGAITLIVLYSKSGQNAI